MSASDIDTWHELWGTFSVRDHKGPGAFVAEALIYDRLLAAAGVVASAGTFVVDELAPKPARSIGLPAATLVLDAQTKLGIE